MIWIRTGNVGNTRQTVSSYFFVNLSIYTIQFLPNQQGLKYSEMWSIELTYNNSSMTDIILLFNM